MAFICENCKQPQPVREKPVKVATEFRRVIYPTRFEYDGKTVIDKGGKGFQITKELSVCSSCFETKFKDIGVI